VTGHVWADDRVVAGMRGQLQLRDEMLRAANRRLGWKLGLGAPAALQRLGTSGPVVAFLTDAGLVARDRPVTVDGWHTALLEPELAVHVCQPVPPDASHEQLVGCIGGIGLAFELIDVDLPLEALESALSRGLFHRNVVLGEPRRVAELPVTHARRMTVSRDKRQVAATDVGPALERCARLLGFTARYLAAFGEAVREGDVVITGSLTDPLAVGFDDRWEMRLEGIADVAFSTAPRPLGRVAIYGAGRMGAQIGCEYAAAGHDVTWSVRSPARAERAVRDAFHVAVEAGVLAGDTAHEALRRTRITNDPACDGWQPDLVVESIEENLEAKAQLLRPAANRWPHAIVATNTSSIPIGVLGAAIHAEERLTGTHYWNPPLLMPLVEVTPGPQTPETVVKRVVASLVELGKRPVLVHSDVPGFLWNRLQFALLREAIWLAENGVAAPDVIDEVVRDGLARRWSVLGPFETAALGGPATFATVAENLLPELSDARSASSLLCFTPVLDDRGRADLEARRDRWLSEMLGRGGLSRSSRQRERGS
jgi:3-hydroxybutyryl-CoA dehydrogenase